MTRKYFGTDGIRGKANSFPMTAEMALKVAMATASVLRAGRDGEQTDRVVIGKDTRLSGYMLEEAMCAGFVSMGMDVLLTGPIPTPGIAMLTRRLRADVGVMISASHNSFEDNGIKLFGADGFKLDDEIEAQIEVKLDTDLGAELASPEALGMATENLEKAVLEQGADIGLALDGDADRLIIIDEKGRKIDGDQLMAVLTLSMKRAGTLKHDTLVSTVMSNLGLERFLEREGVKLLRTQVGDRYVVEAMREGGYNIGGEQSGHIVLSDFGTTGDGLLAALQVLSLLKETEVAASEALNLFTPLPQILRNVEYEHGAPLDDIQVQDALKRAEETLANDGRILVRESGTEPVIRVMAEGDDLNRVENVVSDLCSVIEKVASSA